MTREEAIAELKMFKGHTFNKTEEALEMAIQALEQEPCSDAVSRQAANDAINDVISKYIPILYGSFKKIPLELARAIMQLPPVNPQQKTGHWINKEHRKEEYVLVGKCSVCGRVRVLDEFCPNCGARMESEEISDTNKKMWEEIFKAESEVRNETNN